MPDLMELDLDSIRVAENGALAASPCPISWSLISTIRTRSRLFVSTLDLMEPDLDLPPPS
jgi:hypothetical protein